LGGAARFVRLDSVIFPGGGRTVRYGCGSAGSIGDVLNRVDNIAASATPADADIFARCVWLGAGVRAADAPPLSR